MNLPELENALGENAKIYTEAEVEVARKAYRDVLPEWYAKLWTQARIFEAQTFIYEEKLEDDPGMRINTLAFEGPDDGWQLEDKPAIFQSGYFPIAHWDSGNHLVLVRSDSTGFDAKVWIIDHEKRSGVRAHSAISEPLSITHQPSRAKKAGQVRFSPRRLEPVRLHDPRGRVGRRIGRRIKTGTDLKRVRS